MNKETILSKAALLWWDALDNNKTFELKKKYYDAVYGLKPQHITQIYLREHLDIKQAEEWYDSLGRLAGNELKDKYFPTRGFSGLHPTDILFMYKAEHPTTPIADLTGDKVFDTPVSLFLRQENDVLKERIKVLTDALEGLYITIDNKLLSYHFGGEIGIAKAALEQTK